MRTLGVFAALLLLALPACGEKTDTAGGPLLKEKDREFIAAAMEGAEQEVRLVLFSGGEDCEYCNHTESFLGEIAAESPLITVETLSLEKDAARAAELGIDKTPGIAILGQKDYGLRYFGFPTGYEFITFVETMRLAADGTPSVEPETVKGLAALEEEVRITVFSTKT
jgi:alkyl hydroperoxide reductase subunit AhpF